MNNHTFAACPCLAPWYLPCPPRISNFESRNSEILMPLCGWYSKTLQQYNCLRSVYFTFACSLAKCFVFSVVHLSSSPSLSLSRPLCLCLCLSLYRTVTGAQDPKIDQERRDPPPVRRRGALGHNGEIPRPRHAAVRLPPARVHLSGKTLPCHLRLGLTTTFNYRSAVIVSK